MTPKRLGYIGGDTEKVTIHRPIEVDAKKVALDQHFLIWGKFLRFRG